MQLPVKILCRLEIAAKGLFDHHPPPAVSGLLQQARGTLLGTVLNKLRTTAADYYYAYYYYENDIALPLRVLIVLGGTAAGIAIAMTSAQVASRPYSSSGGTTLRPAR